MDPISDMIIQIKNASNASKKVIMVPHSKVKLAIANSLMKAGFITSVSKKVRKARPVLEINIAYDEKGQSKVHDVKRVSKPSRRSYSGVKELRPLRQGYGLAILSTPKGILTDKEARKEHVGGEVLLTIW